MNKHFIGVCEEFNLKFTRPEQEKGRLDFFLPAYNLFVEVKAHSTERLHEQLESVAGKPVMVLISLGAVNAFRKMLDDFYYDQL